MEWALVNQSAQCLESTEAGISPTPGVLSRLPRECHEEFLDLLRNACETRLRRRLCITRPDGPTLLVDIIPLNIEATTQPPALVVLHDSSEFDASHERFRRLARRNEAILLSSMDGFFVVDEDCRFLEVNEAFCRMTGYTSAELLRMRITDIEVDQHNNGGVPSHTRTGLHHFPTAHRHKDGHLVHLEISVNVLHDNGRKILVGFARDITRRLRAEQELARLSRQQKLILDSAAEAIVGLDAEGRISFCNPAAAELIGTPAPELIGRLGHEVLLGAAGACRPAQCPVCRILADPREKIRGEDTFRRADGREFPVEYSAVAMFDGDDPAGAVLIFRDVTQQRQAAEQRRQLEAQIQQAQKLESLGLLAGGIAHDLNNMLAGIQGHASLALAEGGELPGPVAQRLHRIVGACERASKVIQQILAYSGRVECAPARVDLNDQIREMTEFMRAAVPPNIELSLELHPELPPVELDTGQLQQIVTNLLVNAVEAIGSKAGHIRIATEPLRLTEDDIHNDYPGQNLAAGRFVALIVQDDGCGMEPEIIDRIFEPFFSRKGPGRGLGLSAMHGLIRALHGGIRVESRPGQGARFTVIFPACAVAPAGPAPADDQPEDAQQPHATVLVIDDDDEVRNVIHDMLSYRGMRVLTARHGSQGVELFDRHAREIDVVLLDMTMPDMSGSEVFDRIIEIRPDAKVIIATGYSTTNIASRFGKHRPVGFIHKPFTADTLTDSINQVLHNGHVLKA